MRVPACRRPAGTRLARPVAHVRDVRSELLVKLALLMRRDADTGALTAAQRAALLPVQDALERRLSAETGFGKVLASWPTENVRAALRFLDDIDAPA